ncbi:hypothetical protein [Anaerotignum sp.]|uniref:hypothetical protein n=1 Tax=Anaerotignum sp. TaxID=2039241 RepID=UPI0028B15DBA|nr:hypothetical protein [Anaerotignum sp.]
MFRTYYRIHFWTLILGIIAVISSFLFKNNIRELNLQVILTLIGALSFVVAMIFYYKIISILCIVTDITKKQMWSAIFSHAVTLVALCLWRYVLIAVPLAFVGSVIIRRVADITEIDGQMKELCTELDLELYKIGKESEDEIEN